MNQKKETVWQGWTLRFQKVKCSKPNCSRCPHGPYWYAYRRVNGKLISQYIGKKLDLSKLLKNFSPDQ